MKRFLIACTAALPLAMLVPVAASAQDTTRTLPNGDVVNNQRSVSNGVYNDQRSVTAPNGGLLTNNRTVGNGGSVDTRTGANAAGGSFSNTRTAGGGTYTDTRQVENSRGGVYNSERVASASGAAHSWSGVTAGGRSFAGFRGHR